MKSKTQIALLSLLGFCFIASAMARPAQQASLGPDFGGPNGNANDVEYIGNDSGGYILDYALREDELEQSGRNVAFSGRCDSACTLFLALPESQTCVSPGAYFRFHSPSAKSAIVEQASQSYLIRKYPRWVRHWILEQGGLTVRIITMDFAYASRFMRACA